MFQDKSIHMVFTFLNSTIYKLFMVYIPMFNSNLIINDFFYQPGESICRKK